MVGRTSRENLLGLRNPTRLRLDSAHRHARLADHAALHAEGDQRHGEPRVAVGGVEPQPRRIAQAEQVLAGRPPDQAAFQAAAAAVASAVDPLEDANTSATYRRDLACTVTRRALEQAAA